MFSKRKRGETETRLVKKPELGKNIPGKNRYEDPEAKKIFSNFAEQGKKKKITLKHSQCSGQQHKMTSEKQKQGPGLSGPDKSHLTCCIFS